MPWVRFDDQYPIHRKVSALSDGAFRLDFEGICWAARNLTDGRIRRTELESCTNAPRTSRKWRANLVANAAELVAADRWHSPGHDCPTCPQPVDGWIIHDYLRFQPSAADVQRERAAKAERQARWMAKRNGRRDASHPDHADASHTQPVDASQDVSRDAAPYPPRPEGKRGGDRPEAPDARRQAADAAAAGRTSQPKIVGAHSPPNGARPNADDSGMPPSLESQAGRPPNLAELRKQLADKARQHRAAGNRRPGAFEQLMEAADEKDQQNESESESP